MASREQLPDFAILFLGRAAQFPSQAALKSRADELYEEWSKNDVPLVVLFPDTGGGLTPEAWQYVQKHIAAVDYQHGFIARLSADGFCTMISYGDTSQLNESVAAACDSLLLISKKRKDRDDDQSFVAKPPKLHTPYRYPLHNNVFVGRTHRLNELSEWASTEDQPVCLLLAMGGAGKSALAWHWMNKHAPSHATPFEGFFWWDFYHNADCEKCAAHLIAYLSGEPLKNALRRSYLKNVEFALSHLNGRRILVCLDGVERVLNHYREFDVDAHDALGSMDDERKVEDRLRSCAKQEGALFRALANMHASKAILTSRMLPFELEKAGQVHPGVLILDQLQMDVVDVGALMQALNANGSDHVLKEVSDLVGGHPLALRALAGLVEADHDGDLDTWWKTNKNLEVVGLNLVGRRSHILRHAMVGVKGRSLAVLGAASAFRGPVMLSDLSSILLLNSELLASEEEISASLIDLGHRQLLFVDRDNNQCDMHPLVRGVVWKGLTKEWQDSLAESHGTYFSSFGMQQAVSRIERFDALRHSWFSLIERGRRDAAFDRVEENVHELIVSEGRAIDVIRMFEALKRSAKESGGPLANDPGKRREILFWHSFAQAYGGQSIQAISTSIDAMKVSEIHPHSAVRAFHSASWLGMITDIGTLCHRLGLIELGTSLMDRHKVSLGSRREDLESVRGVRAAIALDLDGSKRAQKDAISIALGHSDDDSASWTFYRLSMAMNLAEQWLVFDRLPQDRLSPIVICRMALTLARRKRLREAELRASALYALAQATSQRQRGEITIDSELLLRRMDNALEETRRRRLPRSETMILGWRLHFSKLMDEPTDECVRLALSAPNYLSLLEENRLLANLFLAASHVLSSKGETEPAIEFARRSIGYSLQPDGSAAFSSILLESQAVLERLNAQNDPIHPSTAYSDARSDLQDRVVEYLLAN